MQDTIFTHDERAQITAMMVSALKLSATSPILVMGAALHVLVAVFVLGFEYELAYQVFYSLAGDAHQYWTPAIMALSSVIIVLGFHYLARQNRGAFLQGFITRIVALMMPLYLLGIGLVIAALLYNDGLRDLLSAEEATFFIDATQNVALEEDWLNTLMAEFTTPIAALAFSAGMGALAILNVFVAHGAMEGAGAKIAVLSQQRAQTYKIRADYTALEQAEADYAQHLAHYHTLLLMDRTAIQTDIAHDAFASIDDALAPVRVWLNEQKTRGDKPAFLPDITLSPKQIEAELKAYQQISPQSLMTYMNPQPQSEK